MMSQLHGLLTKALPTPLVLLLMLSGGGQVKGEERLQSRQDFDTNFGGPPGGDNGFVGANSLPRPQGVIDLESFDGAFAPSDVFRNVENTFNIDNQLTHESATFQSSPTFKPSATFRPSATFQPPATIQQPTSFRPFIPSNDLSKDDVSFTTSNDERKNSFADGGLQESTAFKVFHGSENDASPVKGSVHNDVLTINHEEDQHSFSPQGFQGNQHLRRPGHNGRRPSRPLRRPIHQGGGQPFRGRPRQQPPNNLRREQPNFITLLLG